MATPGALHITRVEGGAWAVKPEEGALASGVLKALECRPEVEVVIHGPDGGVGSILTIREFIPTMEFPADSAPDDPAARAEALRITPGYGRLKAGIGNHSKPPGDFGDEEMAC